MKNIPDPLEHAERIVREANRATVRGVRPAHKKYPLLFAFLVTFSVAAVLHGFELWSDHVALFSEHPALLMLLGVLGLFFTGALYRKLEG